MTNSLNGFERALAKAGEKQRFGRIIQLFQGLELAPSLTHSFVIAELRLQRKRPHKEVLYILAGDGGNTFKALQSCTNDEIRAFIVGAASSVPMEEDLMFLQDRCFAELQKRL